MLPIGTSRVQLLICLQRRALSVQTIYKYLTEKVIVYGSTLDTHCFVQGIISASLTPSQIILIRPPNPDKVFIYVL